LTYYKKPNGQMDEVLTLEKRLKTRDLQTGSVVLDFRDRKVVKASMNGTSVPKDFDRIVSFYHQHYANVIDRLFKENGFEVVRDEPAEAAPVAAAAPAEPVVVGV
jgi:hypothetical protein